MRKIFIFLRIALAKVTKLNHKCLQHLTAILITVFPRNQKPGPKGFCIPTFPSLSPHDSIRRLRDQYIPASSPPHVPSFHCTVEAPKQTSGQPRKWTPRNLLCRWHWASSESVGLSEGHLAWPPGAITLAQDKLGLDVSGKGCVKKHFSPAEECVFPSASSTFCEALPVHLGMPEREQHPPQRTSTLRKQFKNKRINK